MRPFWFNHGKHHLNTICGNQKLADLLHDISFVLTKELKTPYGVKDGPIDCRVNRITGTYQNRWIENEELGEMLVELKKEIEASLKAAKAEGLAEGKKLLKLLNQGEITLKDLE